MIRYDWTRPPAPREFLRLRAPGDAADADFEEAMPRLPITIVIVTTLAALTISCALCDRGARTADVSVPSNARLFAEDDRPDVAPPMMMVHRAGIGLTPACEYFTHLVLQNSGRHVEER